MTIDDILHPNESRRAELAQLNRQIEFLNHALSVLERSALSPQPNNGMGDAGSGTASADITASASRAADAFLCEDCHGTGRRERPWDSAPMACWCEAGDKFDGGY